MTIEEKIFQRYIPIEDKLIEYGFQKKKEIYEFHQTILHNSFEVIITYQQEIKGKMIDLSIQDEYTNFRTNMVGEFHQKVKKEFENLLLDIRNCCFQKKNFLFEQSNRINDYIEKTFLVSPLFLWEKYPNYAVYKQEKWFGIIMDIPYKKLGGKDSSIMEILNVKINPSDKENLLKKPGVFEAYHMNKKNWVSLCLNDTLSDETIEKLIFQSYQLTNKQSFHFPM